MSQVAALEERVSREIQRALRLLKDVEEELRIIGFYFRSLSRRGKGPAAGDTLPVGFLIDDLDARLDGLRVVRRRLEREVTKLA